MINRRYLYTKQYKFKYLTNISIKNNGTSNPEGNRTGKNESIKTHTKTNTYKNRII